MHIVSVTWWQLLIIISIAIPLIVGSLFAFRMFFKRMKVGGVELDFGEGSDSRIAALEEETKVLREKISENVEITRDLARSLETNVAEVKRIVSTYSDTTRSIEELTHEFAMRDTDTTRALSKLITRDECLHEQGGLLEQLNDIYARLSANEKALAEIMGRLDEHIRNDNIERYTK